MVGGGLFVQIDGIEGESTDNKTKDWLLPDCLSIPPMRSIPRSATEFLPDFDKGSFRDKGSF